MKISIDGIGFAELSSCSKSAISRSAYGIPENINFNKIKYLQELRVFPEYRQKGYAKKLLQMVKQYCDDNNLILCLDAMPLDKSVSSDILKMMYTDNGFNHVGGTAFNYGYK